MTTEFKITPQNMKKTFTTYKSIALNLIVAGNAAAELLFILKISMEFFAIYLYSS